MQEKVFDYVKLHVSVLLAGFTGLLAKLISLNEVMIVWYRMLFAFLIFVIMLIFMRKKPVENFKDALKIDQDSWKYKEKSDMLSLDNEQIIYISLLKYCNLYVSYFDNKPIGYSLLIKYNGKYYAAKWGATDVGRTMNSGIICLLKQIKNISSKEDLFLDLWGRRNKIYDRMATNSIKRIYFSILKNGNKKS